MFNINIKVSQDFDAKHVERVQDKFSNPEPGLLPNDFIVSEELAKKIYTELMNLSDKKAA